MQIQENFLLKPFNTFGINARSKYFSPFSNAGELNELVTRFKSTRALILGGGSNVLFTGDFNGIVLKNEISGIEKTGEDDAYAYVMVGAGENWHRFVTTCISNSWGGVENLSLIPGSVGASPMQNIGAYGVEVKEVFHELTAFDLQEQRTRPFTLEECEFGYRDSIFKNRYKNRFVILNVTYRLSKNPSFNTTYGAIDQELEKMGVRELSLAAISQAVINIRTAKLPDPARIGNAGSFFKNPLVSAEKFTELQAQFENIVGYQNPDGTVKLAAGWLIEHCGPQQGISWKGYRRGDAGCHSKQALVLVNYGNANGNDIYQLSKEITQSVEQKFGVELETEVNVVSPASA